MVSNICSVCNSSDYSKWYANLQICHKCYCRKWKFENKEHVKAYKKLQRKLNPFSHRHEVKLRKKHFKQAYASCLDKRAVLEFYKNCPEGFEVDHIIPLKHPLVCGLHNIYNLQYLPSKVNNKKQNFWDGTFENKDWMNASISHSR